MNVTATVWSCVPPTEKVWGSPPMPMLTPTSWCVSLNRMREASSIRESEADFLRCTVPWMSSEEGPSLEGCHVKLDRATVLLQELRATLGPALDAIRHEVVTETAYDPGSEQFVVTVARAPEIPTLVSAIAGDVIHNLRSALDYAVFQAVWFSQGSPWQGSQFPISGSPSTFSHRDKKTLEKLNPDLSTVVRRCQPYDDLEDYRRGGWATDLSSMFQLRDANRPLAVLRELSNQDKHRLLLPRYARSADASFAVGGAKDCAPAIRWYQSDGALVAGEQPLAVFAANCDGPNPRMEVDFAFTPSVGIAAVDVGGVGDAEEVLELVTGAVSRVISEIEPLMSS
jgi:hypothetical protein